MTNLSPAAQAVMDAVALAMEGGWISPEFTPYEARKAAGALRAAALHIDDASDGLECQDILRQVAAELEGAQ